MQKIIRCFATIERRVCIPLNKAGRAGWELPLKTIAKNFVSLVTYPHSGFKRFENPPG
jgi:hypothetical protein